MPDAVDTFRRIVTLIAKWLLFGFLLLAGLGAVIGFGVWSYQYFSYERHAALVKFEIDTTVCTKKDWPLLVGIVNGSTKTLERVSFTLRARRKGHSTDLSRFHNYEDDQIRAPGSRMTGTCWAAPLKDGISDDPRGLEWDVSYSTFTFK